MIAVLLLKTIQRRERGIAALPFGGTDKKQESAAVFLSKTTIDFNALKLYTTKQNS